MGRKRLFDIDAALYVAMRVSWTRVTKGKGSLRDELLNEELFDSLADVPRKLDAWRYDYNHVRPHSSLGNRTPAQARRTFVQDDGITPDALVQASVPEYSTARLSL